jgi:hypothetical protein
MMRSGQSILGLSLASDPESLGASELLSLEREFKTKEGPAGLKANR